MKIINAVACGAISLVSVAGLASPALAAPAPAAAKTDKCSVHVNIAHPVAGDEETLTITSTTADTAVKVVIKYKTVSHTWRFNTGAAKKTAHEFGVGRPTVGYKVVLSGSVVEAPAGYKHGTCTTDFVPESK